MRLAGSERALEKVVTFGLNRRVRVLLQQLLQQIESKRSIVS